MPQVDGEVAQMCKTLRSGSAATLPICLCQLLRVDLHAQSACTVGTMALPVSGAAEIAAALDRIADGHVESRSCTAAEVIVGHPHTRVQDLSTNWY